MRPIGVVLLPTILLLFGSKDSHCQRERSSEEPAIRATIAKIQAANADTVCSSDTACLQRFSEQPRTSIIRFKTVPLTPDGRIGIIASACDHDYEHTDLCSVYVLLKEGRSYREVLESMGSLEEWKLSPNVTNGFYDVMLGDILVFTWSGSKYTERDNHSELRVQVQSIQPEDREIDSPKSQNDQSCKVFAHDLRLTGSTADGVALTMRCTTGKVLCSFAAVPVLPDGSKAADGKPLTCDAGFHVGQTVRFQRQENGDYLPFDSTGFDGTHKPADREHLKSWSIESESRRGATNGSKQ